MVGILVDWHTFGSNRVRYFHRFLPPCCANRVGPEGKELRLLMAAADLWFPELSGYEVRVAILEILVISSTKPLIMLQVEVVMNNASFVDFIENDMSKDAREVQLSSYRCNFTALSYPNMYILISFLYNLF